MIESVFYCFFFLLLVFLNRPAACFAEPKLLTKSNNCTVVKSRWYFNSATRTCQSGVCGGGKNDFTNEDVCITTCKAERPADCYQPQYAAGERFYCLAQSWYYNIESGKCEMSRNSCRGTKNEYSTEEECKSFCRP